MALLITFLILIAIIYLIILQGLFSTNPGTRIIIIQKKIGYVKTTYIRGFIAGITILSSITLDRWLKDMDLNNKVSKKEDKDFISGKTIKKLKGAKNEKKTNG